ncbi:MAG: hypothetical protein ABH817_02325 [archaeon]
MTDIEYLLKRAIAESSGGNNYEAIRTLQEITVYPDFKLHNFGTPIRDPNLKWKTYMAFYGFVLRLTTSLERSIFGHLDRSREAASAGDKSLFIREEGLMFQPLKNYERYCTLIGLRNYKILGIWKEMNELRKAL